MTVETVFRQYWPNVAIEVNFVSRLNRCRKRQSEQRQTVKEIFEHGKHLMAEVVAFALYCTPHLIADHSAQPLRTAVHLFLHLQGD